MGYYATSSGNFLPTYIVPKRRAEVTTTRRIITQKSAVLTYFAAEALN